MFCSNCGKQIGNAGACPYCGCVHKPMPEDYASGSSGNQTGNYYAEQNGEQYNNYNADTMQKRQRQSANGGKKDNMFILIMIAAGSVAVLLLVIAASFIFGAFGGNDSEFSEDSLTGGKGVVSEFYKSVQDPTPSPVQTPTPTSAVKPASKYICVAGGGSWYDGVAAASNYGSGAHLVTFDSIEEFHFVNALAEQKGIDYYWAGMQARNLSDWRNGGLDSAGNRFDMSNVVWLSGEPSGYDYALPFEDREFEDCLVIILKDGTWVANDAPGTTEYTSERAGYIIEIE